MDLSLSEEQRVLRQEIVRFSREQLNEGVEERDREDTFSRELFERCGSMRLPGMPVPEEYGGAGLDPLSTAICLEAFGYGCRDGGLVFSVCAHLLACVVPIWRHGTEEQRRRWLPELCTGRRIAVNGMTEPGSGSDAFALRTRAVPDGDGFRLTGTKTFASNGPVADLALVYAVTDPGQVPHGGITAFVVERGTPGFTTGQQFRKMGLRTCSIGELVLDDARVSADCAIGGVGAGAIVFAESMDWERACLVACHVGTMQRLLEQAVAHARTRRVQGRAIGKFQAVAHRIADMKVRLEAARWLTYHAASRLGRARDVALDASIAKLFTSESLVESALDTVRVLGGSGYTGDSEAERILRDAVGGVLYSGTNDVQRSIIARWLGL